MMKQTKTLTLTAILTALALALSYTEQLIPLHLLIPLPGVKLGLSNIVTLVALYLLGSKCAVTVLILRCMLASLFGGGMTGFLFSLCGGLSAAFIMIMSRRIRQLSVFGVSILGAAAHNMGQICAAAFLMQSFYVVAYLPYLLLVGLGTGFLTGSAAAGALRILVKSLPLDRNAAS